MWGAKKMQSVTPRFHILQKPVIVKRMKHAFQKIHVHQRDLICNTTVLLVILFWQEKLATTSKIINIVTKYSITLNFSDITLA